MQEKKEYKLIRCGRLYDGTCDAMHSNWEILVEDDRIQEVGARVTCPEGTKVIDLSDCTVTPGMIDAHVHFQHVNWQVRNRDAVYKGGRLEKHGLPLQRTQEPLQRLHLYPLYWRFHF